MIKLILKGFNMPTVIKSMQHVFFAYNIDTVIA
jgi:hypothetical protein